MDLALVEAARSGDEEAFASIARGSADRLFAVAHRILRDVGRAEDAVQQTLVTAWRDLPALRDIRTLRGLDPSDPGPCLLCRGQARIEMVRQRRGPAHRRARDAGHHPGHRTRDALIAGSAGFRRSNARRSCCITTSAGRSARSPRTSASRRRRSGRGSATQLPPSGRPSRPMPGRPAPPPGSGWHERERIRPDRPSLARGRPDPDVRPRPAVRPRGDPHDSTAPCLVAGAEATNVHTRSASRQRCRSHRCWPSLGVIALLPTVGMGGRRRPPRRHRLRHDRR